MAWFQGKTLYFPGDVVLAKFPEIASATKELLDELGIDYVMLKITATGHAAWFAGYEREFHSQMERNLALLKSNNIKRVLTNEPEAALAFRRYNIEACHVVEILAEHLDLLPRQEGFPADYIHSFSLSRLGVEPKLCLRILSRCGIHVTKEDPLAFVADGEFQRNNPEIAGLIAARHKLSGKSIISATPDAKLLFKSRDIVEVLGE